MFIRFIDIVENKIHVWNHQPVIYVHKHTQFICFPETGRGGFSGVASSELCHDGWLHSDGDGGDANVRRLSWGSFQVFVDSG